MNLLRVREARLPRLSSDLTLGLIVSCLACAGAPKKSKPDVDAPMMLAWKAALDTDHRLVGRVWSNADERFVTPAQLFEVVASHELVLIGERHDHPDHHQIQALLLQQISSRALVGFEMLDEKDAPKLKQNMSVDELAEASDWAKSGWPSFELYRPIFDAMSKRQMTALAIHPSRERLMNRARKPQEFTEQTAQHLRRLSSGGLTSLRQDINRGHCGSAQGAMLEMMVAAQVFKDHWMASQMTAALDRINRSGAERVRGVIIAGNGHVRKDYGLSNHIKRKTLSIGLIEVQSEQNSASSYGLDRYDYTWFTPRLDDENPCQKYQKALEKMKEKYRKMRSKERGVSTTKPARPNGSSG